MNGYKNMWIMKPGGLSRGRGIKLYKSLDKILDFFKHKDTPWIVMKYIENPLIISTVGALRKVLFDKFFSYLKTSLILDNGFL